MSDKPKRVRKGVKRQAKSAPETPAANKSGTALEAYRWKPGQSGNPSGRPKVIGELRDLARAYTIEGLETLAEVMRDKAAPPAARVAAVAHILDRGYGKPQQNISATVRAVRQMTDDELLAYISGAAYEADGGEGIAETTQH